MSIENIDEMAEELFEPIGIVIDGKEYVQTELPSSVMDTIMATARKPDDEISITVVGKQLAQFFGLDEDAFAKVDVRKQILALRHVTDSVAQQLDIDLEKVKKEQGVDAT